MIIKADMDSLASDHLGFQKYLSDRLFAAPATLYVILIFLRFYVVDYYFYLLVTTFLLAYGFLLALFSLLRLPFLASSFLFVMAFCSLLVAVLGGGWEVEPTIFLVSNFGFASALLFSAEKSKKFVYVIFGFLIWFSLYALAGMEAEGFFRVSRNFVSIFLILILSVYYILCWREGRQPAPTISFLILVLCLWAGGRSGIAVSFGIFLLSLFFIKKSAIKNTALLLLGLGFLFLFLFVLFIDSRFSPDIIFERFSRLGVESVRWDINLAYLSSAFEGFKSFFFGVDLETIDLVSSLGMNPHNSLIALHVNYGFLGLFYVSTLIFISMIFLTIKRFWVVLIALGACVVRSFFDISSFYGPLDPIIYSIFLMVLCFGFLKKNMILGKSY